MRFPLTEIQFLLFNNIVLPLKHFCSSNGSKSHVENHSEYEGFYEKIVDL